MKIVLATSSPYRQAAFKNLGFSFISEGSDIDEYKDGRPTDPEKLVLYLAQLKCQAVAKNHSGNIVIGFDSVGYFDGQVLEKPKSIDEARQRLLDLSGKNHQFYTGIYIINQENKKTVSRVVKTEAWLRSITAQEVDKYLKQDDRFTTYALGYDPEAHYSASFVKKIDGSYNNLIYGMPLEVLVEMLQEVGYND